MKHPALNISLILISMFFAYVLFSSVPVAAQMPDWTLLTDKDGNKFYMDKNGKIWTSGKPDFNYKPVSIEGLDYYLNQGIELIQNHYKTEGLTLLKSILALPVKNNVIYKAQIKASGEIRNLLKNEGSRFKKLNEDASLLTYRENSFITLINDNMYYSIQCPSSVKIISRRIRIKNNYRYYGLLMGIRFQTPERTEKRTQNPDKAETYTGYDLLMAIDSERFPDIIRRAETIENHWRNRLGSDTLKREIIIKNNDRIIYSYRDTHSPYYSGTEGFYKKNNFGYFVKTITGDKKYRDYEDKILEIINSFKT